MSWQMLLFLLVAAHFVADFLLQSDTVAREKNPDSATMLQRAVPWYYWLFAHATSHGLLVGVILWSPWYGMLETAAHFSIDFLKCKRVINIHVDQLLHLGCKLVWLGCYLVAD